MKKFRFLRILMIFLISINANVLADSEQMSRWLDDEDIRVMVKDRLGDGVYIAPAVPDFPALISDIANVAVSEAKAGRVALIPVNINDSHWTALAVRARGDGRIVALYNDSLGHSLSYSNMSGNYIEALRQLVPDLEIIDAQVHQQDDGFSCGLFTARNLIAFALLDKKDLTIKAVKEELEKIREQVKKEYEVNND